MIKTSCNNINYTINYSFTAGEDGQVKIWSRSGMLRSTLVSLGIVKTFCKMISDCCTVL